jgi:hypothetical protein
MRSIHCVDDDHVDGVRLRHGTVATGWPIVHPPGDMSMENQSGIM